MVHPRTRPPKTVEDYRALPEGARAELIAGELYVTPAPRPDHQRVVLRLGRTLAPHVEGAGLGELFIAPVDVHLPTGDVVQPDIVFVAADRSDSIGAEAIHGVPALLIEVLSPSHPERDRIVKLDLYARCGVREYWIVDPDDRSVEIFVLAQGGYEPRGWFTSDAQITSPTLPELDLSLRALFP